MAFGFAICVYALQVYCEMRRHGGGWTRAFHFNVTSQGKCPGGLRPLVVQGVKMCTKGDENYVYEVPGVHFSEVMGYVTGYKVTETGKEEH